MEEENQESREQGDHHDQQMGEESRGVKGKACWPVDKEDIASDAGGGGLLALHPNNVDGKRHYTEGASSLNGQEEGHCGKRMRLTAK